LYQFLSLQFGGNIRGTERVVGFEFEGKIGETSLSQAGNLDSVEVLKCIA